MGVKDIIADEDIEKVHANADFCGFISKRDIVNQGLLKCVSGFYQGHTSTRIITEHGLIDAEYKITPKGKMYLWEAFKSEISV